MRNKMMKGELKDFNQINEDAMSRDIDSQYNETEESKKRSNIFRRTALDGLAFIKFK